MKLVAKCSAFVCLSYQVHVKVCNPIPLRVHIRIAFQTCGGCSLKLLDKEHSNGAH